MAQGVNWIELRNEGGLEQTLCSDFGRWPAALELMVSATLLTVGRRSAVAASGRCKRYS
jgi:hypothetical protein